MKKILVLILALILVVSSLTGCSLVEKNPVRENAQAVVTIGNQKELAVTLGDIISLYNTYGYLYVYYYGMQPAEVFTMLLNQIVNERLYVLAAMENLPKISDKGTSIYDEYLSKSEIDEVAKEVNQYISNQIDLTEVEILTEWADTAGTEIPKAPEIRKLPDGYEKNTIVPLDFVGSDSRFAAVNRFKRLLEANGSSYDKEIVKLSDSFKQQKVLDKFSNVLKLEVNATDADVDAKFKAIIEEEQETYAVNATAYKDKLDKLSDGEFAIFSNQAGFGFVYNILIPFTDEQAAELKGFTAPEGTSTEQAAKLKAELRAKLLSEVVGKDLRETYLTNYGYDKSETGLFNNYDFDGTVTPVTIDGVQIKGENGLFKYDTIKPNEYKIGDLMNKFDQVLSPINTSVVDGFNVRVAGVDKVDNFYDMIYAYNTDDGAFNNKKGYLITPKDASVSETYVQEFADAARAVAKSGVGSYTYVGTDYGYHIIMCVETLNKVGITNTYNAAEKNVEGTFSNLFFNNVNDSLKSGYVTSKLSSYVTAYLAKDKFVVRNQKLIKDTVALIEG